MSLFPGRLGRAVRGRWFAQPVRVFWEDKRGPVTRPRVPRRTGGTFGSRAETLRSERTRLCEESHAADLPGAGV